MTFDEAEEAGNSPTRVPELRHRDRPGRDPLLLRPAVLRRRRGQRRGDRPRRDRGHDQGRVYIAGGRPGPRLHHPGDHQRRHRTPRSRTPTRATPTCSTSSTRPTGARWSRVHRGSRRRPGRGGGPGRRGAGRRGPRCLRGVGRTGADQRVRRRAGARGILCIGCSTGEPDFAIERAPYLFTLAINAGAGPGPRGRVHHKKLDGFPADPRRRRGLQSQDRKFGYLWIESTDDSKPRPTGSSSELEDERTSSWPRACRTSSTRPASRSRPPAPSPGSSRPASRPSCSRVTPSRRARSPRRPPPRTTSPSGSSGRRRWSTPTPSPAPTTSSSGCTPSACRRWPPASRPTDPVVQALQLVQRRGPAGRRHQPGAVPAAVAVLRRGAGRRPEPHRRSPSATGCSAEPTPEPATTQAIITYGDQGYWDFDDYYGSDDVTEVWWDPRPPARTRSATTARACGGSSTAASATCPASGPEGDQGVRRGGYGHDPRRAPAAERPKDYPRPKAEAANVVAPVGAPAVGCST